MLKRYQNNKPIIRLAIDLSDYMRQYREARDKLKQEQQEATERRLQELAEDEPFLQRNAMSFCDLSATSDDNKS